MPQRAINLLWAVMGLLAVAGLVVVGVNLYRAARTGPKWKRRLILAGLVLASTLGFGAAGGLTPLACCYMPTYQAMRHERETRWRSLARRLELLRQKAEEGKLQDDVIEKEVASAERELAALNRELEDSTYSAEERQEAERLRDEIKAEIQKLRVLLHGATCYDIVNFSRLWKGPEAEARRVAMLEKLSRNGALSAQVVARARASLDTQGHGAESAPGPGGEPVG